MNYLTKTQFALFYINRKFKKQIEHRKRDVIKKSVTEEYLKQRGNVILGREDLYVERYYLCYDPILVIAPFKLIDFASFMENTREHAIKYNLEQVRKSVKKVYELACENLEIYDNSLLPLLENNEIPKEYLREIINNNNNVQTVLKGGIDKFDENGTQQIYDNDKFAYYCSAIKDYLEKEIFEEKKPNNKLPVTSFESTLTEPQLKTLFTELISDENRFIHPETTPEQFKAIFSNEAIEGIKRVKWIDRPDQNKAEINTKTLFEFLYLLKENELINRDNFDTGSHNNNNFYKKINLCFSDTNGNDINDIRSKCPHKAEQNTIRKKLLSEIINNSTE